ncbi:MAG: hypothetical protein ABI210_10515 [Abditibacteriaceae bacterium]
MSKINVSIVVAIVCIFFLKAPVFGASTESERRYVSAFLTMRFDNIAQEPEDTWIIAEIDPSSNSGSLEGLVKNPDTNQLEAASGRKVSKVYDGELKSLYLLKGIENKQSWQYKFNKPALVSGKYLGFLAGPLDQYYPFSEKRLVVCRINSKLNGLDQFAPIFMIPQDWQDSLVAAWKYYQQNQTIFQSDKIGSNKEVLRKLLNNENPILVIMAARALAHKNLLDETFIKTTFNQSTGVTRAVFTSLLLLKLSNDEANNKSYNEDLDSLLLAIKSTPNWAALRYTALGVLALQDNGEKVNTRLIKEIINAIKQKQVELPDTDKKSNEELNYITTLSMF